MSKFIEKRKRSRMPDKGIVILYHGNCSDGFGGAWAAWKKFGSRATYIGVQHQADPPQGLRGREIYMIDFTYPHAITQRLLRENKRVTAVDHHVTVAAVTKMTAHYSYALHHSGAVLAWRYFHPKKKVPRLLLYIEDIDLWKFKLHHTREILAYLDMFPFDFAVWSKIVRRLEDSNTRKQFITTGKILLRYQEKIIERLAHRAELVEFLGYKTLAVNSPIFESEIGHQLYQRMSPVGIVWHRKPDELKVSLRSDGTVDVSKLAQKFGGGGHRAAAGFTLFGRDPQFPWKPLKT